MAVCASTAWWNALRRESSVTSAAVENEPPNCSDNAWNDVAFGTTSGGIALSTAIESGTNISPRPTPAMIAGPSSELKSFCDVVM